VDQLEPEEFREAARGRLVGQPLKLCQGRRPMNCIASMASTRSWRWL
jgi:hypothetical protein